MPAEQAWQADYALSKIRTLQHYGITPYIVLDGANLPSKQHTEVERAQRRADALAKAKTLTAQGQTAAARDMYLKACDVTPQMAYQLIKLLQAENIQYVVAPYEADAQMCYLEKEGLVDGVITEDSDLLVFGCNLVLTKWDKEGYAVEIKKERLTRCKVFRLDGWSEQEFRHMAILSGCDYLPSIPGVGCKTAHRLMRKYRNASKVIAALRLEAKFTVPRSYVKDFERADSTFLHQCIYDPRTQKLLHLFPLPPNGLATDHLLAVGAGISHEVAYGIATGAIDPTSKLPMVDIHPEPVASTSKAAGDRVVASSYRVSTSKTTSSKPAPAKLDIRNFFQRSASNVSESIPSRPALAKVAFNSPKQLQQPQQQKGKSKYRSMAPASDEPTVASKFFGKATAAPAPAPSAVVEVAEESDDDELEISFDSQRPPLEVDEDQEVEVDDMLQRTQKPAAEEEEQEYSFESVEEIKLERAMHSPTQEDAHSDVDSAGGVITSPLGPSPIAQHTGSALSQDTFHFTSPLQADNSSTSPPPPSPIKISENTCSPAAGKRKRDTDLVSDISDFSPTDVVEAALRSPPKKARQTSQSARPAKPSASTKKPARRIVQESEEPDGSTTATEAVVASWRAKFALFGNAPEERPKGKKYLASLVSKAVKSQASTSAGQSSTTASTSTPVKRARMAAKPIQLAEDTLVNAPGAAAAEAAEPTHWKKVSISSSRLLAFQHRRI